jgi:hypothetical protein
MSARLIPLAMFPDSEVCINLMEFRQMNETALDQMETCVQEAKNVVHQTQTKMDELEKTIDEMNDSQKGTASK